MFNATYFRVLVSCSGRIPLRELVYRVLDLPPSMRPLVYDFGQLKQGTEDNYIKQIVHDHVSSMFYIIRHYLNPCSFVLKIMNHELLSQESRDNCAIIPAIARVLATSQAYMRKREVTLSAMIADNFHFTIWIQDECSFVSLRDVERAMIVFKYFYEKVPDFQKADRSQELLPNVQLSE